jgi:hypothetical protein
MKNKQLSTSNKLATANALMNAVAMFQRRKLNKSISELLSTSQSTLNVLENISENQGQVLDEARQQTDEARQQTDEARQQTDEARQQTKLLSNREQRDLHELALKQFGFELIKETIKLEKMNSDLERYFNSMSLVPHYEFLKNEIVNISNIDEKIKVSESLEKIKAFSVVKSLNFTKQENEDLSELLELGDKRKEINQIRDSVKPFREKIQRMSKLKQETAGAELGVKMSKVRTLYYWYGIVMFLPAYFIDDKLISQFFMVLAFGLIGVRLLLNLFGVRKKALAKAQENFKQDVERAIEKFTNETTEECNRKLKKFKKVSGSVLTIDDSSNFTKEENAKLTREFTVILKRYPTLKLMSSKA